MNNFTTSLLGNSDSTPNTILNLRKKSKDSLTKSNSDSDKKTHVKSASIDLEESTTSSQISSSTHAPNTVISFNANLRNIKQFKKLFQSQKQQSVDSDDDLVKICTANNPSPQQQQQKLLRPPQHFFKTRRRSKTYSGEEFAVHLEKLNKKQQQKESPSDSTSTTKQIPINNNNSNKNNSSNSINGAESKSLTNKDNNALTNNNNNAFTNYFHSLHSNRRFYF
jgi:hypothetical protein